MVEKTEDEIAATIFAAAKTIAAALEQGSTESLRKVHTLLGELFLKVTEPRGRIDNFAEQRIIGTLWAEIEEILDVRDGKYIKPLRAKVRKP